MPKVSILLTSYNHEKYVGKSIESILNQTYTDYELIILDDHSTDNSWKVISKYKDKRIRAIRRKKNLCYALSREMINSFNGEYFAIAHCDDLWEPTKLEKQVKYLDSHKRTAACFTHVKLIDEQDNEILENVKEKYVEFNVENRTRFEWLRKFFYEGNCLCHPSILMRKNIQIEEDLFTFGLGSLPDFYRWIRLTMKYDIHIITEKLTCFRLREKGKNSSGKNKNNLIRYNFDMIKVLNLYKELNKKDFYKVFPQATKYEVKRKINIRYALARICIDEKTPVPNVYQEFGLNILYELIQNNETREEIKNLYNYTLRDFIKETGNIDIYNKISSIKQGISSVYYKGENDNFDEKNSIKQIIILKDNEYNFVIKNKDIKKVTDFRFDPIEGEFIEIKDLKIEVDGEEIKYKTNKTLKVNKQDIYLNTDPNIYFKTEKPPKEINIKWKMNVLSNEDVQKILKDKYIKRII